MSLTVQCPSCSAPCLVPDHWAGKETNCNQCGGRMRIPEIMIPADSPLPSPIPVKQGSMVAFWLGAMLVIILFAGGLVWWKGLVQFSLTGKEKTPVKKIVDDKPFVEPVAELPVAAEPVPVEKPVPPIDKVEVAAAPVQQVAPRFQQEEKPPVVGRSGRRGAVPQRPAQPDPVADEVREFSVKDYINACQRQATAKDMFGKKVRITGVFLKTADGRIHLSDSKTTPLWIVECDFDRSVPSELRRKEYEDVPTITVTVLGVCQDDKQVVHCEMLTSGSEIVDRLKGLQRAAENSVQKGFEVAEEEVRAAKKSSLSLSSKRDSFVKFTGEFVKALPVEQGVIMAYFQDPKKKNYVVFCKFRLAHREAVDKLYAGQIVTVCGRVFVRDSNPSAVKQPQLINCYLEE